MRKVIFASIFVLGFCFAAFSQDSTCPKISITGPPAPLASDANAIFTVSVEEKAENLKLEYFWSVDKGKIIEGQKTRTVTIGEIPWDTTPAVAVEIKGLPEGCPNIAYDTAPICHCIPPLLLAELKISTPRLDKALFDAFIYELKNYPSSVTGYIIIYNDDNTSTKKLNQREQQIRKYLSGKNVPANMVVIVRARERKDLIRLFIVPQGAEPPTP